MLAPSEEFGALNHLESEAIAELGGKPTVNGHGKNPWLSRGSVEPCVCGGFTGVVLIVGWA